MTWRLNSIQTLGRGEKVTHRKFDKNLHPICNATSFIANPSKPNGLSLLSLSPSFNFPSFRSRSLSDGTPL